MKLPHLFTLPDTATCVVIWERNDVRHEQLLKTPSSCSGLQQIMLARYHVGYSEIKCIQSVDPKQLIRNFATNFRP